MWNAASWKRWFYKACRTIADRDDHIEQMDKIAEQRKLAAQKLAELHAETQKLRDNYTQQFERNRPDRAQRASGLVPARRRGRAVLRFFRKETS